MKIFILEDDPNRMVKFMKELTGHRVDHAETVDIGFAMIKADKYDLLFLDHDLGGAQMVDSSEENTGYELAKLITSSTSNKETPCIIHSCNPVGADNMVKVLPHAHRIPFFSLNFPSIMEWIERISE